MSKAKIGDINIYYERVGTGPDLVFIHGLGSSTQGWDFQKGFSSQYKILTYDVRGHGKSDKPKGPYSVPLFSKDLAGLFKKLDIQQAHIVGISMGGWIVFQFAADYPEMVKSLTIVNSWADMIPKTLKERWTIFQRLVIFRLLSMEKIGETLSKRLFIKPEQEKIRQSFVEQWAKNDKSAYMASMKGGVGWTIRDQLSEIKCPTLVIAADEDYSTLESKEEYVALLPNAKLIVIKDSRHATPVEKPEEFNNVLASFLKENN